MIENWIKSVDLSLYGCKYVLMRDLFYDYVYFCKSNGISDIATDRAFSKALQSMGFRMKYTNCGTAFLMIRGDWDGK